MTITKRLLLTLSISLLSLLVVGGYGLWQLSQAQARFHYVQMNTFPSLRDLDKAQGALTIMRAAISKELLATPAQRAVLDANQAEQDRVFDAALADYQASDISNVTDQQLMNADKAAMVSYRASRNQVVSLIDANQPEPARVVLFGAVATTGKALSKAIDDHIKFNYDLADDLSQQNNQQYSLALALLCGAIVAAFFLSGVLGAHLYRIIRHGLAEIQNALETVGRTLDFTQRAPVTRQDEIGRTATAFNGLLQRMQQSLGSLLSGSQQVATASRELAQTAAQVSSAASSQSESAANMAATIEQMTVSVNHVAEQARQTHSDATDAGQLVAEGSQIIGQTIRDIHEISAVVKTSASSIQALEADSGQVSSVIRVIREIADQTNLLALNAAIEAARAGETGRGFAVVADEVRKLAERTARSTQEISVTIKTMVTRAQQATQQMEQAEKLVALGVSHADDADAAIKRIGLNTTGATRSISEISSAIQQQGVASNNIAVQVEQTAQASEQSSQAAQHTAQSAQQLDRLASEQITTLAQYTI